MLTISFLGPLTAGQERFRSISRLYYRGANACILCYSITDAQSFADMGAWLTELRRNLPHDIVLHVVGTKSDVVAREPSKREVPFERCIVSSSQSLRAWYLRVVVPPVPASERPLGVVGGGPRGRHDKITFLAKDFSRGFPVADSGKHRPTSPRISPRALAPRPRRPRPPDTSARPAPAVSAAVAASFPAAIARPPSPVVPPRSGRPGSGARK